MVAKIAAVGISRQNDASLACLNAWVCFQPHHGQLLNQFPCSRVPQKWESLEHFWAGGSAVRAMGLQFVPNRLLIDSKGKVVKHWDGTHGNVVGGRHGKSRDNHSTDITDEIAQLL